MAITHGDISWKEYLLLLLLCIKKYSSTFYLGMEQVQNCHLYVKHRSSSKKNKAEEFKKLLFAILMLNLLYKFR